MPDTHDTTDKDTLRERVWDHLEDAGEARFPFPPHGRIPNFAGADAAADRLQATTAWETATTVKANPDAPQLPVRRAALRAGKTVYAAVPRLREPEPFLELDPAAIPPDEIDDATTVSGISTYGDPVAPEAVPEIDLIVSGSVLVTPAGGRVGKGEGYSDLEFGVLSAFDAADGDTTVATTVHESQVRSVPDATFDAHDVPVDVVCTPERTLTPGDDERALARPNGIDWDAVGDERLEEIPVLARLAAERGEG